MIPSGTNTQIDMTEREINFCIDSVFRQLEIAKQNNDSNRITELEENLENLYNMLKRLQNKQQ